MDECPVRTLDIYSCGSECPEGINDEQIFQAAVGMIQPPGGLPRSTMQAFGITCCIICKGYISNNGIVSIASVVSFHTGCRIFVVVCLDGCRCPAWDRFFFTHDSCMRSGWRTSGKAQFVL